MYEGLVPCPHRKVDDSGHILCSWIKTGDRQVSVNLCRACPVPQINCQHLRAALEKSMPAPITVRFATGRVEVWDDEPPGVQFKQAACAVKTMPIHSARDCAGCPLRVPQVIPQNAIQVARQNRNITPPAPATAPGVPAPVSALPAPAVSMTSGSVSTEQDGAVGTLVRQARQVAGRKRVERVARAQAAELATTGSRAREAVSERGENKSKIILLQEWLSGQLNKKTKPSLPAPSPIDQDGVSEIVYSPIAQVYQEEAGLERCVGWTD